MVTGAGVGIGQGIAQALARQGAAVALHYSASRSGAEEAASAINAAGGRATTIAGDLRLTDDCARVVDEAAAFLGVSISWSTMQRLRSRSIEERWTCSMKC
ncbi:MAG: SDR family NAD(P)-dependent oxidoreductase [Thermomicrobiales bacterium]